ncbi:hypothetical protein HID58_061348 [Brassica napus]|uniref:Uncharacterized protein n=1 Tax=Brassica napus TaxID=3708 RepID=A0ABQ7ZYB8_BRANA|nr:hypothetical protein HID58_061348 [Brassica napus]
MSSSDVVAQSAFDVLRLGRSSQFIVARLLRFWTPKTSGSFLTNGHQNLNRSFVAGSTRVCNPCISQCSSFGIGLPLNVLGSLALWFVLLQYRESELVTGEDDAYRYTYIMGLHKTLQGQRFAMPLLRIALQSPAGAARGQLIFKDLSRLKRFNSEEAIEYGLIIVRPPHIKDDAPLQDETRGLG